ncbi:hypothetical protein H8D98_00110 [bacterium]|nr:hypothetical protein [bacterium]
MNNFLTFIEFAVSLTIASPFGDISTENPAIGTPVQSAEYILTGLESIPEQNVVRFHVTFGNVKHHKGAPYQWICLDGVKQNGDTYACWALVDRLPWDSAPKKPSQTARYLLQEGDETPLEYVNALTGEALLPELRGWDILFPRPLGDSGSSFPERMHYLGFGFARAEISEGKYFSIPHAERLAIRPDMLVGTGRNFRDLQGARLLNNAEYDYTSYSREDIEELIEVGFNHFWVDEEQREWIRRQPAFYIHRGNDRYPELLYRSNMRGGHAYYDEPGHIARRNMQAEHTPSEMAQLVVEYTQNSARTEVLHRSLEARSDIALGDLNLCHPLPSWETAVSTVWYQMRAGAIGAIHEGRYVIYGQPLTLNMHYGCNIPPYPEYIFRYYYAFLRGAARHFGCDWGTAVYGRLEQPIAPHALTLAYDMGARYFWFWTSDHGAHLPYPEQVNLARTLKAHAEGHPERDMQALLHSARVAIVLPDGYTFEPSGLLYNQATHYLERKNEYGVPYRRVLHNAAVEMERLLRLGIEFDIVVDADGFNGEDYEELIFARPDGTLSLIHGGSQEILSNPRIPPRPRHISKPNLEATCEQNTDSPQQVTLRAKVSGGSPPLGFDAGCDSQTGMRQRNLVVWEHYSPTGGYRLLHGAEHILTLTEPGRHRFRAVTADSYGSVVDRWLEVRD